MKKISLLLVCFFSVAGTSSCKNEPEKKLEAVVQNKTGNKELMLAAMQTHLDAISNRDLKILESTLSPEGTMQLILPGTDIIENTAGFMDYHREWFKSAGWTIDSKILNSEAGETMAMVIVESLYQEAERDGQPYFNKMIVSYALKKINKKWYVIKDHMASVQKSTDQK
ncbi:nuclear transport factor 2 family protein [Maribacter sp.]|nr:nuclear transport factor 2 family protein [Maribacter sp.]